MNKISIEKELTRLQKKSEETGLTEQDYITLKQLLRQSAGKDSASLKRRQRISKLLEQNENPELVFNSENYNFIITKLSVLPFVFRNGGYYRCRTCHDGRFKFYYKGAQDTLLCVLGSKILRIRFKKNKDKENKVSNKYKTEVIDSEVISNAKYISEVEQISYNEALQVLVGVYNCECGDLLPKLKPIIEKYKESLISDDFGNFLKNGRDMIERTLKEGEEVNYYIYDEMDSHRKRVEEGKVEPNFVYKMSR